MALAHGERKSKGQILKSFIVALPALTLSFVIRAAVIQGVATATEVSTTGIFVYRCFDIERLYPMLMDAAHLCFYSYKSITGKG